MFIPLTLLLPLITYVYTVSASCLYIFLQIDLKLVAEAWGISSNAARMRYARLKAHIEKMQQAEKLNEKSEEDAQMDEKKEDLNENDSEQEKDEAEGTNELVQEGLLDEDGLAMEG